MKKVLFFALFLAFWGTVGVNAQVRIGGNIKPQAAAVLDLNVDSTATPDNKGALALPRMNLISATMPLNGGTPANGMLIYNTGTTFVPGIYVWITDQWVKADANALKITAQPAPFTFRRLQDTYGDPNGPTPATAVTLSVTATGPGTLTYGWYEKPKNQNVTALGTKLASTATYTPPVTAWGMRTYYCLVSNGTDTIKSNYADVAIGCGAKTMDGRWLSFMCYNLGADPSLDPFTYTSLGDTTSFDSKGWLFQWGRVADGHQWRSSATQVGPVYLPTQDQVPATGTSGTSVSLGIATAQTYANYYGKFITATDYEFFRDWRTPQIGWLWYSWGNVNDPCPSGWQLPTQSDFATIISDNAYSRQSSGSAVANTWVKTTSGYQIKPDNTNTTLFLPFGGQRLPNGSFENINKIGDYWTSTASASGSIDLHTTETILDPNQVWQRGAGHSVRCVPNH